MALGNKEIMAKNIKRFMDIKGVNQTQMCNDLGLKFMTLSDWVNAKTYPRIDKIEIMARYFGVTKADLVEEPSGTSTPEYYMDPDAAELAEFLHKNPDYKVLFDASRKVKPEDIEFIRQMIDRMGGKNES